jgi:hypothetical protein
MARILVVCTILLAFGAAVFVPALTAQDQPEPICPLTQEQSKKSVEAFAKIAKFLVTEPRCVNCHGAVNPYIDGTGTDPEDPNAPPSMVEHGGGKMDHEKDAAKKFLVDQACAGCHSNMAPRTDGSRSVWMTAPNFLSFVGKDAKTLCKQIKDASGDAKHFMGHMKDDNGGNNFTGTSYNGDRGLDRDLFSESEIPTQKPSVSHAELMRMGQEWIDAMGGRFHGGPSCGCEDQSYALQVDYVSVVNLNMGPISGQYTTTSNGSGGNPIGVEIPLEIKESGEMTGQALMTMGGQGNVMVPRVGTCTGQSQQQFLIHATAHLEEGPEESHGADEKLHAKLECDKIQFQSSAQCPYAAGSQDTTNQCAMAATMDFIPASVNASKALIYPLPMPNSQATLTTTIVKKQ